MNRIVSFFLFPFFFVHIYWFQNEEQEQNKKNNNDDETKEKSNQTESIADYATKNATQNQLLHTIHI